MLNIKFLVNPGLRIVLLFLTWIVGSVVVALLSFLLIRLFAGNMLGYTRLAVLFQDIFMWIVPALVTAVIITRQPAGLLAIDRWPSLRQLVLGVLLLIVSSPFMSWVIRLNADLHLPESMAGIEAAMRTMEANAEQTIQTMLAAQSIGAVIVNVLIIGIFAGFSEELFFRGAMQRIIGSGSLSAHAAIWITAFIFSAMHLQFFGFVPRMLLGAAFGYLLLWSGSVWLPMFVHALNNSLYVALYSATGSGDPDYTGLWTSWAGIALSAILTAATFYTLHRTARKQ